MKHNPKRCTKCVLPETFPKISFNSRGVCNFCTTYEKSKPDPKKEKRLAEIFEKLKKRKQPYDCLVPVSGGKDSAYVLYLIKTKFKLNPLAITLNNLFRSDIADQNLGKILEKLDVDHIMVNPRPGILKKLYKRFLENEGKGKFTSEFCIPCNIAIWVTVNRYSGIFNIPVIYGGIREIESSPEEIFGFSSKYFKEIAKDVLTEAEIREFIPYDFEYENASLDNELNSIWLFDYVYWRRSDEKKVLEKLGWSKGNNISEIHVDCTLHDICSYFHMKKWGGARTALHYSKMIRRGDMKRYEAMALLEKEEKKNVSKLMAMFRNKIQ